MPLTVIDVFITPLFTVSCKFWGALALTVTVPGAEHVASPVEPIVAAVVPVIVAMSSMTSHPPAKAPDSYGC